MANKPKYTHEAKTLMTLPTAHHAGEVTLSSKQADVAHNTAYTQFALTIAAWPKPDLFDGDQTAKRCGEYFNLCAKHNHKPTITALGLALHLDRVVLLDIHLRRHNWRNYASETSAQVIDQAYIILNSLWESWMLNGQVNPASGIFLGKNNFGYKDVTDIQVTPGKANIEAVDAKYKDLPADEMN